VGEDDWGEVDFPEEQGSKAWWEALLKNRKNRLERLKDMDAPEQVIDNEKELIRQAEEGLASFQGNGECACPDGYAGTMTEENPEGHSVDCPQWGWCEQCEEDPCQCCQICEGPCQGH
jgi:hypothetical protein